MRIVEKYKIWFGLSIVILLIGLFTVATKGLNYGIDFTGGTMIQVELGQKVSVSDIENTIAKYNLKPEIVHIGEKKTEVVIKTTEALDTAKRQEVFNTIKDKYKLENSALRGTEQFGPAVGKELQTKALIACVIASLCMLVYISFRFQYIYGVAAITALLHDVFILITVYAVFRIPVNSPFIAAVLTVLGYSINDTIVVFDRVRERTKDRKKQSYIEIGNESIRSTLARSINTTLVTLLVISGLYVFGVESVKLFALPLIVGIATGAFSSIFVATPIWSLWMEHNDKMGKSFKPAD